MLILVGVSIQAQDSIARLDEVRFYFVDQLSKVFKYEYDEDNNLKTMKTIINGLPYDTVAYTTLHYSNDYIYKMEYYLNDWVYNYYYTNDRVYEITGNGDTSYVWEKNANGENTAWGKLTWSDGNPISYDVFSGNEWTATYQHFRNPVLHTSRYFKCSGSKNGILKETLELSVIAHGSYNLMETFYWDGEEYMTYVVTDSIGVWPTKIDQGLAGEYWHRRWEIDYRDWVPMDVNASIEEIPTEPFTVLQVSYYDIMGREIPKPTKGFYIERKVTDKGIISTKHYIP
jgi:hypothetical protein